MFRLLTILLLIATFPLQAATTPMNFQYQHVPDQLILKFKKGAHLKIDEFFAQNALKKLHSFKSGAFLVAVDHAMKEQSLMEVASQLGEDDQIAYIEANTIVFADNTTPNDPRFAETWGLRNDGSNGGKVGADISAPKAWDLGTGSKNVLVAVIDTGVDYNHPDLKDNIWINPGETGLDANGKDKASNGVDDDGDGFIDDWHGWNFVANNNDPMDDYGHGTHCAGTIGASGNNGAGVAGVSWKVSLVPIKFLNANGSGNLSDAVKSVEYATKIGAQIMSNSWGGGGFSQAMADAVEAANGKGILFIAAAGNSHSNNDTSPHYPSSYQSQNVIAVAATNSNDNLASFSSYGWESVHLAAPGEQILSTTPNGQYEKKSGTSMATPHVSGAAALIRSVYPTISHLQIKERLIRSVDRIASLKGQVKSGGRLNLYNALENDTIPPGVVTNLKVVDPGYSSFSLTFTPTGDDGDEGQASYYELRTAKTPIASQDDWDRATRLQYEELDGNKVFKVVNLPFNTKGYLAVRAFDNVGNIGDLSESIPFALKEITVYKRFTAENFDEMTAQPPWGLEAIADREGRKAFSDSPGALYANSLNISLTLPPLALSSGDTFLVFDTFYDLEQGYDYGYVEISTDKGASWQQLLALTGKAQKWDRRTLNLSKYLSDPSTRQNVLIRFRIVTDYSIVYDGWKFDDIQILDGSKFQGHRS